MQDLLNNAGFIALVGTIFGGVGLKLVEHWLNKSQERTTEQQNMREELREEIQGLKNEIRNLNLEVDKWRGMYYTTRDEKITVETNLRITQERLEVAKARLEVLENQRSK